MLYLFRQKQHKSGKDRPFMELLSVIHKKNFKNAHILW